MKPKTCINYFRKEMYAFNINELQEGCACVTLTGLNAGIKTAVFENSLPLGSADFTEIGDPPEGWGGE